jgi:hypothetical protein
MDFQPNRRCYFISIIASDFNVHFPDLQPTLEDLETNGRPYLTPITTSDSNAGFSEPQVTHEDETMDFEPDRRLHLFLSLLQTLTLTFQRCNLLSIRVGAVIFHLLH